MNAWKKKVVNSESGSYLKVSLGGGGGISPLLGSKMALNVKISNIFAHFPNFTPFSNFKKGGGRKLPRKSKGWETRRCS